MLCSAEMPKFLWHEYPYQAGLPHLHFLWSAAEDEVVQGPTTESVFKLNEGCNGGDNVGEPSGLPDSHVMFTLMGDVSAPTSNARKHIRNTVAATGARVIIVYFESRHISAGEGKLAALLALSCAGVRI